MGGRSGRRLPERGRFADHSSYTVVNAYAEWRPASRKNVVFNLNVDNLLDENYYERTSYVQLDARSVYPLYAPGRTITLGASSTSETPTHT